MKRAIEFLKANDIICDNEGNVLSQLPLGEYGLELIETLETYTMSNNHCYTIINNKLEKISC